MNPTGYWLRLSLTCGLSILVETSILMVALSSGHGWRRRLFAGIWLTSCTYPVVAFVFPFIFVGGDWERARVAVSETFAPVAECLLFWLAFDRPGRSSRAEVLRDFAAIVAANLASFGAGELVKAAGVL